MAKIDYTKLDNLITRELTGKELTTKIAHNTTAQKTPDGVTIRYHGKIIIFARLNSKNRVTSLIATLAGYGTPTTRQRLTDLTRHLLGKNLSFVQRDYTQYLAIDGTLIRLSPNDSIQLSTD